MHWAARVVHDRLRVHHVAPSVQAGTYRKRFPEACSRRGLELINWHGRAGTNVIRQHFSIGETVANP